MIIENESENDMGSFQPTAFFPMHMLRFILALLMSLMLRDHGMAMIATVCSTWVFVNRATKLG